MWLDNTRRVFVGVCALSILGAGAYLYWAKARTAAAPPTVAAPAAVVASPTPRPALDAAAHEAETDRGSPATAPAPDHGIVKASAVAPDAVPAATAATTDRTPVVLYRYTGVDANYGKLAMSAAAEGPARFIDALSCEVVYFAAGSGICLTADRGVFTTYAAELFDEQFQRRARIPLQGIPSRCRISPDGRLAALTVFLSGHSYTSVNFSTQTLVLDARTGQIIADLERDFTVLENGKRLWAQDFNFWGVTFSPDSTRFFCTLSTAGKHYLVEGDITSMAGRVVHENVECPSISPDGTRVAYKKRLQVDGRLFWQLTILDLATGRETSLGERNSIDDQLEWYDEHSLLYARSDNPSGASATTNVWRADAAGRNAPILLIPRAYSPSVSR